VVPLAGYMIVVALAKILQLRIWQVPLLAMFSISLLGTIVIDTLVFVSIRFSGASISFQDAFGLHTLPRILLNLILSVPVYAVMRDLAHWAYPSSEVE